MQAGGPITDVKTIAERIRAARERRGWSQAELARRAGVSAGTIGNLESGTRERPRALLAIAEALAASPKWVESGLGLPPWIDPQHQPAGVAQPVSLRPGDDAPEGRVEVPVTFEGRPAASGSMVLQALDNGGLVAAAFAGRAAFAVKITGDAYHPAIRHGSFVVCDPEAPPVPGELVLLQMRDGTAAFRELVVLRDAEVTTLALAGGTRETLQAGEVERLVPVVMVVSSSRWRPA